VKKTINVTEAVRNFADCVTPHYQNVTFVLLKKGAPFARLVPDNEKICLGRDLAGVGVDHHRIRAAGDIVKAAAQRPVLAEERWKRFSSCKFKVK
jgi:hypothetical protein